MATASIRRTPNTRCSFSKKKAPRKAKVFIIWWGERPREPLLGNDFPHRRDQRLRLGFRSDGDTQIILHFRKIEPAHQNFSLAQSVLPFMRGKSWRLGEDEIRPARKHAKAELRQFARKPLARGDDALEIRAVVFQVV